MSRRVFYLNHDRARETVVRWAKEASPGTRVEFRQAKRTDDQNKKLWACLGDIAKQVEWYGVYLSPDDWKDVLTASLRKARVVPGIDAGTFVPLGMRTSEMTKQQMSELLELIMCFGAERGVVFHDEQERAA